MSDLHISSLHKDIRNHSINDSGIYFQKAEEELKNFHGEVFVKENPDLVIRLATVYAIDALTASILMCIGRR